MFNYLKLPTIPASYRHYFCEDDSQKTRTSCHLKHSSVTALTQAILLLIILTNIINCGNKCLYTKCLNTLICVISLTLAKFIKMNCSRARINFNIFIAIYSFLMFNYGEVGTPLGWFEAQLFPILAFSMTRSSHWFFFHTMFQAISIHRILNIELEKSIMDISFDIFIEEVKYFSSLLLLLRFVIMITIINSYDKHHSENVLSEQESKLLGKQKDFLLRFSHEFRNHAHSIVGNIKLAGLEQLSEKTRGLLLRAEVSGELLLQYVNNILDAGKLDVGELEINLAPTRIYDVIEKVWRVSCELMRMKEVTGSIKISKKVPSVLQLDTYRIIQIFLNLIHNAIKYTEKGSISVFVDWIPDAEHVKRSCFEPIPFNEASEYDEGLFEKQQAFSVFDEELFTYDYTKKNFKIRSPVNKESETSGPGVLKVTITDTGCGIKQEDIAPLWDLFFTPLTETAVRRYGSGLGLFVTKKLCNKMKGDIQVYSKPGKGSSFIFCIPTQSAVTKCEEAKSGEGSAALIRKKQLKGMIVDDVHFNNLIIKNFFEKLDIEVSHMAENGLEACNRFMSEAMGEKPIGVITMDIDMPYMDGKKAAQKIREYEASNDMPPSIIVMISGDCSDSDIKECMDKDGKIKANGFLKKPANIEELTRMIATELAK